MSQTSIPLLEKREGNCFCSSLFPNGAAGSECPDPSIFSHSNFPSPPPSTHLQKPTSPIALPCKHSKTETFTQPKHRRASRYLVPVPFKSNARYRNKLSTERTKSAQRPLLYTDPAQHPFVKFHICERYTDTNRYTLCFLLTQMVKQTLKCLHHIGHDNMQ